MKHSNASIKRNFSGLDLVAFL